MSVTTATELVQYQVLDDVAFVALNVPPLNIMTGAMMSELATALERAQQESTVKAIALTANGRAFSAGADVGEHRPEQAPEMIAAFSRLFRLLGACEVPLVIGVDGAALGAGFEVAMMADVLIASSRSTFGQPEIRLGFFAPVAVATLATRIGQARAIEVTCTGRMYTAKDMRAMGLVSQVVAVEDLQGAMNAVLAELRKASAAVMRLNVRLVRALQGRPFEEARQEAERVFLDELMKLEDVREGIASFYEKRAPAWKNR
jgi:cyclohexa-1,5-dienecarbonyl-CoA hydratase